MWRVALPHASRVISRVAQAPRSAVRTAPVPVLTHQRTLADGNSPRRRSMAQDIKDYSEAQKAGSASTYDTTPIPISAAQVFPRIKTTSLSTKRVVIHDKASQKGVTLVLVAFRSFADAQLQSWRDTLAHLPEGSSQWYDVTINESFGAQAFSGFIQRWQRSRTDAALHDYYVSFNSKAREPLESLLPSTNRMYGYVLMLDRQARVRFRASGMASEEGMEAFLQCARKVLEENGQKDGKE